MEYADDLFLGMKGCVVRIRKRGGEAVWRTRLEGRDLVVVAVEPDGIFACTRGRLWALEPDTGAIRWTNELPGLGYGYAVIVSANQVPVAVAAIQLETAGRAMQRHMRSRESRSWAWQHVPTPDYTIRGCDGGRIPRAGRCRGCRRASWNRRCEASGPCARRGDQWRCGSGRRRRGVARNRPLLHRRGTAHPCPPVPLSACAARARTT